MPEETSTHFSVDQIFTFSRLSSVRLSSTSQTSHDSFSATANERELKLELKWRSEEQITNQAFKTTNILQVPCMWKTQGNLVSDRELVSRLISSITFFTLPLLHLLKNVGHDTAAAQAHSSKLILLFPENFNLCKISVPEMNLVSSSGFPGMQHHVPMHSNQRNPFAIQELLGLSLHGSDTGNHVSHPATVVNGIGHPSGGVCSIRPGPGFYSTSPHHHNHQPVNVTSCLSEAAAASAHHAAAATARMYFSNPSTAQLMNTYMPNVGTGSTFPSNHSQHVSSFLNGFSDCTGVRDSQSGNSQSC